MLIFDEITSGFRLCAGGIHLRYGVNPDMAVFAKSIANGYAMAAILGIEPVMQAAQKTFISSTNWTERIGPTAALATINKYISKKVDRHIISIGQQVKQIWIQAAEKNGLPIQVSGLATLGAFVFNRSDNRLLQTLFTVKMLERGFLGFRQFKPAFAHQLSDVIAYGAAVDAVFQELTEDNLEKSLLTPLAHQGFVRLTKE